MTLLLSGGKVRLAAPGRAALVAGSAAAQVPGGGTAGINPLSGVRLVQPEPAHPAQDYQSMIGHLQAVGGIGPYTFTVSRTALAGAKYLQVNDCFVRVFGDPIGTAADKLRVTVTDGLGTTITRDVPVLKRASAAPAIMLLRTNFEFTNTAPGANANFDQGWQVRAFGGDHTRFDTATVSGAGAGAFTLGDGGTGLDLHPLYGGGSTAPVPPGDYPLHLTSASASETLSADIVLRVPAAPPVGPMLFQALAISSTAAPGTSAGRALATTPTGGRAWTLEGPDAGLFDIKRSAGTLSVKGALTPGDKQVTLVCTDKAVAGRLDITVPVAAGTTLPASSMSMAVNPNLDNHSVGQAVGTASVAGMTGTPRWSIVFEEYTLGLYGSIPLLFSIDPGTGAVTAPWKLSASQHPGGFADADRPYLLTVIAHDGVATCSSTFAVPVAAVVGPTLHVGRGMAAAHPGTGFERLSDVLPLFVHQDLGAMAGATVLVHEDADRDYYAGDNQGSAFGICGPVTFRGVSASGARVRVGGTEGSSYGGYDYSYKGFFVLGDGDCTIENFEISFVTGAGGVDGPSIAGIRKNADCCGDLVVLNCHVHDCPDGILSGSTPGRVFIKQSVFSNTGYVFNPSTHGSYIGAAVELVIEDSLSFNANSGHCLKTRARRGTVRRSRFYDGERGSASCQFEMPQGGSYALEDCFFHKGPNATNSALVQFGIEIPVYPLEARTNHLTVSRCTFSSEVALGTGNGSAVAVRESGILSYLDGSPSTVTLTDNRYYLANGATRYENTNPGVGQHSETGGAVLAVAPALDFTDPGSANPPAARPGWLVDCAEQGAHYDNFWHRQIDPGNDDIRLPAGAAAGTVVATCTAFGASRYDQEGGPTDPRIQPFGPGSVWEVTQDPEYFGGSWAPAGRYLMDAATGQVTLGQALPGTPGTDFFKARVTGPGGVVCDRRVKVSIITDEDFEPVSDPATPPGPSSFRAMLNALPTTPPDRPGEPWNNGGSLSIS